MILAVVGGLFYLRQRSIDQMGAVGDLSPVASGSSSGGEGRANPRTGEGSGAAAAMREVWFEQQHMVDPIGAVVETTEKLEMELMSIQFSGRTLKITAASDDIGPTTSLVSVLSSAETLEDVQLRDVREKGGKHHVRCDATARVAKGAPSGTPPRLPADPEIPELTTLLSRRAKTSNARVSQLDVSANESTGSLSYTKLNLSVEAPSPQSLVRFLVELKTLERLVVFRPDALKRGRGGYELKGKLLAYHELGAN